MKLKSVVNGKKKFLEDVNDEAFSQKMMGDGIAIIPADSKILAPASGEITMIFPTHHAFGMRTNEGIEILIHIGIDTVEMNGDGFESFVKVNEHVEAGELLVKIDLEKIKEGGYESDIMMIITNTSQYQKIIKTKRDDLTINDIVLEII